MCRCILNHCSFNPILFFGTCYYEFTLFAISSVQNLSASLCLRVCIHILIHGIKGGVQFTRSCCHCRKWLLCMGLDIRCGCDILLAWAFASVYHRSVAPNWTIPEVLPQIQNKQKTQCKLEIILSLLMKWITRQVVIIPGTGCEWFSKENDDFFTPFIPSSLGIRVCSYSRETLHLRRHNPKSYLSREELLTAGITV